MTRTRMDHRRDVKSHALDQSQPLNEGKRLVCLRGPPSCTFVIREVRDDPRTLSAPPQATHVKSSPCPAGSAIAEGKGFVMPLI